MEIRGKFRGMLDTIHFDMPQVLCISLTKDPSWTSAVFSPLQSSQAFYFRYGFQLNNSSFCRGLFKIALRLHLQPTDYCCVLLVSFCFYHKDRIIKTQLKQQQYYKNLNI